MTRRVSDRALRRCDVLGAQVVAELLGEVLAAIGATLAGPEREAHCLCPVDAHCVVLARWMGCPGAERARRERAR